MNRPRLLGVLAVMSLFALAACDSGEPAQSPSPSTPRSSPSASAVPSTPTDLPENALVLIKNQPNSVAGLDVIAIRIEDDGAELAGSDGTAPATSGWAEIGQSVEISGVTIRVLATWVDTESSELDGADRSRVWVVVE